MLDASTITKSHKIFTPWGSGVGAPDGRIGPQ